VRIGKNAAGFRGVVASQDLAAGEAFATFPDTLAVDVPVAKSAKSGDYGFSHKEDGYDYYVSGRGWLHDY
jgi:hypothetical protein